MYKSKEIVPYQFFTATCRAVPLTAIWIILIIPLVTQTTLLHTISVINLIFFYYLDPGRKSESYHVLTWKIVAKYLL